MPADRDLAATVCARQGTPADEKSVASERGCSPLGGDSGTGQMTAAESTRSGHLMKRSARSTTGMELPDVRG